MLKSKCCNSPIKEEGIPDFIGGKEIVTVHYICSNCGKLCNVETELSVRIKELADVADYMVRQLRKLSKEVEDEDERKD